MANNLLKSALSFIILSIIISQLVIATIAAENDIGRRVNPTKLKLRKEKLTHFRVYFHEVVTGLNPTAVFVLRPPTNTTTGFGSIAMIDNALTMGIELNSKLVGRAQGLYSSAAQTETSLLMAMNFVFVEGKYNGSTISILGRNSVMSSVREMPIIGGSGLFRFARGYVLARTRRFDMSTGDATVEYNVYVLHY